jgi:hypothetical protein
VPDVWPVKALSWALTMMCVAFLWVFFRAESWGDAWLIIKSIFTNFHWDYAPVFVQVRKVWCVFMLILIGSHAMPSRWWDSLGNVFVRSKWIVKLVVFILVVQLVLQFRSETVSPFIYFQF